MKYYLNALRNYANFNGRASLKEYWLFYLFNSILGVIIQVLSQGIGTEILSFVFMLLVLLPSISVGVRRIQDTGKNGWLILVPIYNLILLLTPGEKKENEFGVEPM